MELILPLIIGYIADLLFGDPRWLPHPIVLFGNMISFCERHFNKGRYRLLKGALTAIVLPVSVFFCFAFAIYLVLHVGLVYYYIASSLIVFYCLANHSLISEGRKVIDELEGRGLEAGRARLSWIVGRDTSSLSKNEIYTAVLETMAENLSDGVVAPLFYYLVGAVTGFYLGGVGSAAFCGCSLMLLYKMVDTLDSMIAYRDERYREFGCFAAHIDDVFNYIPARLTAFIMALLFYKRGLFSFIRKYGPEHASPNSGYPESALAGILGCRFGGTHIYHGIPIEKPYIGSIQRDITLADFKKTVMVNQSVTLFATLLIVAVFVLEIGIETLN